MKLPLSCTACFSFLKKGTMLLFILCVSACTTAEDEALPPLSLEKTAAIFTDFIMADAAAAPAIPTTKDTLKQKYYAQVLEIHNVTLDDYELAMLYYTKQDSALLWLFNEVDTLLKPKKEL